MFRRLASPWVIAGLVLTFAAGVAWLLAPSRLDLSHAYPFVGPLLAAMVFGGLFFCEAFARQKLAGAALIAIGIALSSQD